MPRKRVNRCPSWDEHWGCAISPAKRCSGCPSADWHTESVGKSDNGTTAEPSDEKTKKTRKSREQFYKAYEWFRYPDVVHVKKDCTHSDVVCFKEFGSAYMEVTDKPSEDTEIYVKLPSFVKYATRKIGLCIDRLRDDMNQMGTDFPHDYMPASDSSRIEALHTAIGILIRLQSEIEKDGLSKLKED